jgi:hypothetical protein
MHFDSTRADHISVSKCKDAEIVLLNGRTSTLQKLDMLMADMTSSRTTVAKRDEAAHILKHSPFKNQRSAARQYLAFGALNDTQMQIDDLADLAATAGRWFLWGLAAATAAMMLSMAYDLAIDLPGVIARAQ